MNKLLAMRALAASGHHHNGAVAVLKPSPDKLLPSMIEQVVCLQRESDLLPGISLVKVDNRGSEINFLSSPSRLYLGIHKVKEAFEVEGNYLVLPGIISLTHSKYESESGTIVIEGTTRDEQLRTKNFKARILLKRALDEVGNVVMERLPTYYLKTTIGYQNLSL